MNDATLQELKTIVEQSVWPIRATMVRKRQIREELLGHLMATFEEEVQRVGDERTALDVTKKRFGNRNELAKDLQRSVGWRDQWRSVLESLGRQPGESVWHLALKHFLFTLLIYSTAMLVALPLVLALLILRAPARFDMAVTLDGHSVTTVLIDVIVKLVLFNTALSFLLALVMNRIGPVVVGSRLGRISLSVLLGLVLPFALTGLFAPAAIVLFSMVRQVRQERQHRKDWA
jgi:hypothetical protein